MRCTVTAGPSKGLIDAESKTRAIHSPCDVFWKGPLSTRDFLTHPELANVTATRIGGRGSRDDRHPVAPCAVLSMATIASNSLNWSADCLFPPLCRYATGFIAAGNGTPFVGCAAG